MHVTSAHLFINLHTRNVCDEGLDEVQKDLHLGWLRDLCVDLEDCLDDLHSHALQTAVAGHEPLPAYLSAKKALQFHVNVGQVINMT